MAYAQELASRYANSAQDQYEIAGHHDNLGLEEEAIPYYEKALALGGLTEDDLMEAFLGLGSSYRNVGRFEESQQNFDQAMARYPKYQALKVFAAMTIFDQGRHTEAFALLLRVLAGLKDEELDNSSIAVFHKAITFYADEYEERSKS